MSLCLTLAAATLSAFWPVIHFDFINFDDLGYIIRNLHVRAGLTLETCKWAFTSFYGSNWHPLTWISHALDCQVYGLNPTGHHLTSLLLHLANTLLVFLVLQRMTGAAWRTAFVAALFGLHPLHVESVAWVAERKDVLCAFFFLLSLWAYARYADKTQPRSVAFYLLSLLFFALGLMSKPMLVTLPFVLLLLDYWPLKRVQSRERGSVEGPSETDSPLTSHLLPLIFEKVPFFALSAADCYLTVQAQHGAIEAMAYLPMSYRIPNALVSYVIYLKQMFWPKDLIMYYPPQKPLLDSMVAWSGMAMLVLTFLVIKFALHLPYPLVGRPRSQPGIGPVPASERPYLLTGWLWFIGMLVPVIGLVQVGMQAHADRYTYLPLIGLFIALTWLVADLPIFKSRFPVRLLIALCSIVILAACWLLTSSQVRLWKDSETLYRRTLDLAPDNPIVLTLYGNALIEKHHFAEGADQMRAALQLSPSYSDAESNLGFAIFMQGQSDGRDHLDEAMEHYRRAIALKPTSDTTHYVLSQALMLKGRRDESIAELRTTLAINPENPAALNDLTWILATDPDPAIRNGNEAIELGEKACRLTGYANPLFIGTLAAAYAEAGRFDDASKTGEMARRLAESSGLKAIADKNAQLLDEYKAGKPHREPEPGTNSFP